MSVKKLKKKHQLSEEMKKDIEQYTLPTPAENIVSEEKKDEISFSPSVVPDSGEENVFWYTKIDKIWIACFGILIFLALAGGIFMYREAIIKSTLSPTPTPVEKPQISPTLTPASTPIVLDLSKYKIKVLNGSGIEGSASKIKVLLEEEKFAVSDIGNADRSDYKKTVIQAKKTVPEEFIDKLNLFLEKSYDLDDTTELAEADDIDVIIILSKEKINTPQ